MGQVEIYLRTRKEIATSIGRKTTHGMPSTEKHLDGMRKSAKLTDKLSKGHLSEKHIACHKQKDTEYMHDPKKALQEVLDGINEFNKKAGSKIQYYSPGDCEHAPAKQQLKAIRFMDRTSKSSFKALFNSSLCMSPYAKRLVRGILKYKQIRPMRILLEPQERVVTKHKASKTYKYRKIDFKKGRSKENTRTQIVYPTY